MNHPLNLTLDRYLGELAARGEFDRLGGRGERLDLSPGAPSVLDRLMQETGAKPVAVLLKQKQTELRDRLLGTRDPVERKAMMREIADLQTRIAIEIEAHKTVR